MAYIGNTATTQAFTPAVDYFNGDGATVAFTLSKPVASVAQVQAVIENVPQNPGSAYTVSGNTITFTSAPPSGTSNIYVYYTSPITQVIAPSTNTVGNDQLQNDLTIEFADGSASTPSITNFNDTNTGIFFPAADTIAFAEGGAEAMRIDSSGRVGINTTSPAATLDTYIGAGLTTFGDFANSVRVQGGNDANKYVPITFGGYGDYAPASIAYLVTTGTGNTKGALVFGTRDVTTDTRPTERMRIDSSGNLLVGKTATGPSQGLEWNTGGSHKYLYIQNDDAASGNAVQYINRQGSDGSLIIFRQATTDEGSISVSGTTVSYNGGHLSRWAQTTTAKDESLKKGTVLSNLDEMNVYVDADGNAVENEQLNKVKVSDVEGDANVAGVFVNWDYDEAHQVDEINMAMTGDMIIRIAEGVTVARGDLLMSAGDGTAKPQGDDIVRSKTIAKVTSTHVTCTYDDGSYCVPCVLMAC
jgi:hypothetical protein